MTIYSKTFNVHNMCYKLFLYVILTKSKLSLYLYTTAKVKTCLKCDQGITIQL